MDQHAAAAETFYKAASLILGVFAKYKAGRGIEGKVFHGLFPFALIKIVMFWWVPPVLMRCERKMRR